MQCVRPVYPCVLRDARQQGGSPSAVTARTDPWLLLVTKDGVREFPYSVRVHLLLAREEFKSSEALGHERKLPQQDLYGDKAELAGRGMLWTPQSFTPHGLVYT